MYKNPCAMPILVATISAFMCASPLQSVAFAEGIRGNNRPCISVDRTLTDDYKKKLAIEAAKQLQVPKVDVLAFFKTGDWQIIYSDPHDTDEVFLFYSRDPLKSRYLVSWSGAASTREENQIKSWTVKSVPGIPDELAECFAWYVTKGGRV